MLLYQHIFHENVRRKEPLQAANYLACVPVWNTGYKLLRYTAFNTYAM